MEFYNYNHSTINKYLKDFYEYKYNIYPGKKIFTKICSCSAKQSAINLQHAGRKGHGNPGVWYTQAQNHIHMLRKSWLSR